MSRAGSPLDALNAADDAEATARLLDCCGSRRWAAAMARARPFASAPDLIAAGERELDRLTAADWEEAFAAHPRIGARSASANQSVVGAGWSAAEQAGAAGADGQLRQALAAGNRRYERKFGRTYVVRAAGRDAGEMLALLERRLGNDAASELAEAAGEQRQITRLRLDRMLSG